MIHGIYIEVEPVVMMYVKRGVYFFYFCSGRGLGKTYSSLDMMRRVGTGLLKIDEQEENSKFLYLRRSGVEAETIAAPEACPFKKYNKKEGYEICGEFHNKLGFGSFYLDAEKKDHIGYCAALSTFSNLRGVDFSDVSLIVYDECIPENKNKKPIKDEGFLFLDLYETINRNRALEGKKEVVVIFLSNPIDLSSDLLSQLQLTPILNNMILNNQQKFTDYDRVLHIEKYKDHPISKQKEAGALYKFAQQTGYNARSLSGEFTQNDMTVIRKANFAEYDPYLRIENIIVYKHKSDCTFHISSRLSTCKYEFKAYQREKVRDIFYWQYKLLVRERLVTYDNYSTKTVFEAMINYKPLQ